MTDAQGQVVWSANYEPFGKATVTTETVTNHLRFPGQYYDTETGLHYNWNRYYDPRIGRYITSDPIGLRGGLNTYAYGSSNPLRFVDVLGLSSLDFNGPMGELCMYDRDGELLFCCNATNNIDSRVRSNFPGGHWPPGRFPFRGRISHRDDGPNSPFGSYGNLVFGVPGHTGMGIHSGMRDIPDGAGRSGSGHATEGCIRTTDNCMQRVIEAATNDPLTGLTVGW